MPCRNSPQKFSATQSRIFCCARFCVTKILTYLRVVQVFLNHLEWLDRWFLWRKIGKGSHLLCNSIFLRRLEWNCWCIGILWWWWKCRKRRSRRFGTNKKLLTPRKMILKFIKVVFFLFFITIARATNFQAWKMMNSKFLLYGGDKAKECRFRLSYET